MVDVRPFKALMFDWDDVDGSPATVTSPPYDILSAEDVARLKKQSAHNVTHLTLPDPVPGKAPETKYERAAQTLKAWKKEGLLHQRTKPALFAYDETYDAEGGRKTARGLVGLLGLDAEYAHVRPHERTHKGPIQDRLELLRATGHDLEPIQFLYKDDEARVNGLIARAIEEGRSEPLVSFTDGNNTEHRLWAIEDPGVIEEITAFFGGRDVYIADGHHRYATALHYAAERRKEANGGAPEGPQPYDYKLSVFVNRDDPGLSVYPTHRLVFGLEDVGSARERLAEQFDARPIRVVGDAAAKGRNLEAETRDVDRANAYRFIFYWGDEEADVVTVPNGSVPQAGMGEHSAAWKALDVAVLHNAVLPPTLGVDDRNAGEHLRYTRLAREAVEMVDRGEAQVAVFMNATPLPAVTEIADQREHMPQKSTYFQPKLQSGLLFSALR